MQIKMVSESETSAVFSGYGVLFDRVDLHGEKFVKDTGFLINKAVGRPVFINHTAETSFVSKSGQIVRMLPVKEAIGEIISVSPDDTGLYMEFMIDKASKYWEIVEAMFRTGKMGLSTGTDHTADRDDDGTIKYWPVTELSVTLTPAEPETSNTVTRIKSDSGISEATETSSESQVDEIECGTETPAIEPEQETPAIEPEQETPAIEPGTETPVTVEVIEESEKIMSNDMEERMKQVTDQLDALAQLIVNNTGKMADAGIATPHEENGGVKSFADFIGSVVLGNRGRLEKVYKSYYYKAQSGAAGNTGGYVIPEGFISEPMRVAAEQNQIVSRLNVTPISAPSGQYPAFDQYAAPTAGSGNTALAAGITAGVRQEGGAYSEQTGEFAMLNWNVSDALSGTVKTSRELRADAPAIEGLLNDLIATAHVSKREYYALQGSGVGEPLGILNWAGTIGVAADSSNTFAYEDMLEMWSRFKKVFIDPVFIAHPSVLTDIGVFEIGSNGAGVPTGVGSVAGLTVMPGSPFQLVLSEHLPQSGNANCVILADLGAYRMFELGGVYIDFSEHADFTSGNDVWRFGQRIDGKPALVNSITLADPQGGYTVSPFVKFTN